MSEGKKKMSIYALLAALFAGGGYVGIPEAQDALLSLGDQRWVTVAAQNLQIQWNLEDEIAEIENKIINGKATQWDRERLAVLKDRLKRLSSIK